MSDLSERQTHNTVQNTAFDKPKQEEPGKKFLRILSWQPSATATGDDSLALSSFERMMQEQPVVNLTVRQKKLDLNNLKELVRQFSVRGASRKELLDTLSKQVDYYVNGQIITAIMMRMGDMLRDGAARAVGAQYEMVYGAKIEDGEIDPAVRGQRVEAIEITSHDLVVNTLLNNGVDFRIFLGIVKKPAFAFAEFKKQITAASGEDIFTPLSKRLVPSLALLDALFLNEQIWHIVQIEMGLQILGKPEAISVLTSETTGFFGKPVNAVVPGQFENDTQQLKVIVELTAQEKQRLTNESIRVADEIMKEQLAQKEDLLRKFTLEDQQEENRLKKLAEVEEKLKPARQAAEMLRNAPRPLKPYEKFVNMITLSIMQKDFFIPRPHPDLMAAEMELSRLEGEYESQKIPIPKHTENTPEEKAKLPQEIENLKRLLSDS